jgi:hypothetical protein
MKADEKISQNDLSISACYLWRAAMRLRVEELGWVLPDFEAAGWSGFASVVLTPSCLYIISRFVLALVDSDMPSDGRGL